MSEAINFIQVRHAESIENFFGKEAVKPHDFHLTGKGIAQAKLTGQFMAKHLQSEGINRVVVLESPAQRTEVTGFYIKQALEMAGIEFQAQSLASLGEVRLVPRLASESWPPPTAVEGFLGRYLEGLTVPELKQQMREVTREAQKHAAVFKTGTVIAISHRFRLRLYSVMEILGLDPNQVDKLIPFENANVWQAKKGILNMIYPISKLIGTRARGILEPISYEQARRQFTSNSLLGMNK